MNSPVRIPGTKPGHTSRNAMVVLLYALTFPIWLTLAPVFVGGIVYKNAGGWADALSSLPGIQQGGGVTSAISAFTYTLGCWYIIYWSMRIV